MMNYWIGILSYLLAMACFMKAGYHWGKRNAYREYISELRELQQKVESSEVDLEDWLKKKRIEALELMNQIDEEYNAKMRRMPHD